MRPVGPRVHDGPSPLLVYPWDRTETALREPMVIEPGAVGELVYTHLTREAMPAVRFLGGDIVRIEGSACECGRTTFRMRVIGRRDDMFIVRGVNVYPSAILAVIGEFRPRVTGRARVIRNAADVSIMPPVPIEIEVKDGDVGDGRLKADIEDAIHRTLIFRAKVDLVPELLQQDCTPEKLSRTVLDLLTGSDQRAAFRGVIDSLRPPEGLPGRGHRAPGLAEAAGRGQPPGRPGHPHLHCRGFVAGTQATPDQDKERPAARGRGAGESHEQQHGRAAHGPSPPGGRGV